MDWRSVKPTSPLLVFGPEDYLASRAIGSVKTQLRNANAMLEVHELSAADYESGMLENLASPSLFGEPRLLILTQVEKCNDAFLQEALAILELPQDDTTLVFRHDGSSVRGKKLLDALRAAGTEVTCEPIKKEADRANFVIAELAGRKVSNDAVRALLETFGEDLAELASACSQLLQDSAEAIDVALVETYFGGRVETTAFKVADAAVEG
ncbi:MAG: hypothetical protein RL670_683, partial [Actinomycetota bacterium]